MRKLLQLIRRFPRPHKGRIKTLVNFLLMACIASGVAVDGLTNEPEPNIAKIVIYSVVCVVTLVCAYWITPEE